jgi:hypothetical protein
MPKGTKVHRLTDKLKAKGLPEGAAIATAQKQTRQSYATGKALRTATGKRARRSR